MARSLLVLVLFGSACGQISDLFEVGKRALENNSMGDLLEAGMDTLGVKGGNGMGSVRPGEMLKTGEGALDAMAGMLKECSGDRKACKEQAMNILKNMTGRDVGDRDMPYELLKAGAKQASKFMKECMANATGSEQKRACLTSNAAKRVAALASGKDLSEISDGLLRKFAREGAMDELKEAMKNCTQEAADESRKKACFNKSGLKDSIADAIGMDPSNVVDSMVREFLNAGATKDMLLMLQNCRQSESNMSACKQEAKALGAKVLGKKASDISDDELELDVKKAMFKNLGDRMESCMEAAAGNKAEMAECGKVLAIADLKATSFDIGWEPSDTDVAVALMKAAEAKAKEVSEDCTKGRNECMELLKESAAKAMGKLKTELTTMDVETLNMKGALQAAKDAAEACYEAKKADVDATCQDPFDKFMELRKTEKPKSRKKLEVMEKAMQVEFIKGLEKDRRAMCFEKESKETADDCLADFKTKMSDMAGSILKEADKSLKDAKLKRAQKEASVEVVGERFMTCMKSATDSSAKSACKDELKQKIAVAGLDEDSDKIMMRHRGRAIAAAVTSCDAAERKKCRDQIKAELELAGMKKRQFGTHKKLAEIKAAAEIWASCKENETNTEEECATLAIETLKQVSGVSAPWTNETAQEVKALGQALLSGINTVLRKFERIDVDAGTTGSTCLDTELGVLRSKLEEGVASSDFRDMNISATLKGCRLVDSEAQYRAFLPATGLNETGIDQLADSLVIILDGADLSARRLREARRLATVTETYADQAVKECAETDTSCGEDMGAGSESGSSGSSSSSAAMSASMTFATLTTLIIWE
eukprot:TRINITY_DN1309_c0_g1_i5.p1 TRINITY_DN1309_c0_g1~~TRINITY_DN1309_c0_g1_i5.p1  ORF type:complete len:826 (-),score=253.86 TRINITY_DN1309_c0_g1_i5:286-2763(-)